MNSAGSIAPVDELSEGQRQALLTLLGDEDPAVYRLIRDKIVALGPAAADWLRPYTLSRDAAIRRRAQQIVIHFDRQAADTRFLTFCVKHGQDLDLEYGAWLLAQTRYPDINVDAYQAMLDSYARDLCERIPRLSKPLEKLATINDYLFSELGFTGNEEEYYDPDNSYLNRVIDRRTGNPINVCLFYILIARRLKLPVTGIGLPGHFVCRYQSTSDEVYVDAFGRGKFLTKADCVQYLVHGNYSLNDDYLTPVTSRRMLLRICINLHQIYVHQGVDEEVTRFQRYLVALGR